MDEKNVDLDSFDINQYLKYVFGITDKELKDLHKFANDLIDLIGKFFNVKNKDFLRKIIAQFNLLPAYGGLAIFEIVHFKNETILEKFCDSALDYFNANKQVEQNSDFIKDLNEVISSLYFFSPDSVIRKILIKYEEKIFNFLTNECANRSAVYCLFACRYGDLYLASRKTNTTYIERIKVFFEILKKRVTEANNIIPEIQDAMNFPLKEIRKLIFTFKEDNKKDSLDQLKIILTRKIDLGNLIYNLIIGNESAIEAIFSSDSFITDILQESLPQLKLQQLLEMAVFLQDKSAIFNIYQIVIKYIEENYTIFPPSFISKIREFVSRYETTKHGILIRVPDMMPIEDEVKNAKEACKEMLLKLSTLANNLTALSSQSSLAVPVVLRSKTNLYNIFVKEYDEKKHGNLAGALAGKTQNKDFMQKIKESDLSSMILDQMTCKNIICILISLQETIPENFTIEQKESVVDNAFKVLIKKYKIIMSKDVFMRFVNIFFSKIPSSLM